MNQKELSFMYRGVIFLIFGGIAIAVLSSLDRPWVHYVRTVAIVVLFVAGAAFIIFVTFAQFKHFLDAPLPDEPLPPSLYLDPWYRVARLAVAASVLLAVSLAAILLFVEPPKCCPGWHLVDKRSTSFWLPFFMFTVPILAGLGFVVTHWKWVIEKAIVTTDYPTTTPVPYTLVMTVLLGSGMAQLPWALLVTHCWLRS